MKSITINGSKRESVGKVATRTLRNAGKVPCVVYGGDEPIHFSADELAFTKLIYTPDVHTVVVDLGDGKNVQCILQDIQFHPVTDRILHIDFFQIFDDKEVMMEIPVRIVGNSRGVRNGGVLRIVNRKLRVKAIPENLPDFIEVDISEMKIGDIRTVASVLHEDYKIMHEESRTICQVRTSRTAIVDVVDEDEEEEVEGEEGEVAADEVPATEVKDEAAVKE